MKNILVVCPTERDKRELANLNVLDSYSLFFHTYDADALERIVCQGAGLLSQVFDPAQVIDELCALCDTHNIHGVVSSEDYPGSIFASVVAHEMGLIGPDTHALLLCQHKYYSRIAQQESVPEATPLFTLFDQGVLCNSYFNFPAFAKPVKSFFSVLANKVYSLEHLKVLTQEVSLSTDFLSQFNWFVDKYTSFDNNGNGFLVEQLLQGEQATLEGYVCQGDVHIIGVVDSIMFPGTISFKRFEYPSKLPAPVQNRMAQIARACMKHIGFNNGFFNIEFMCNADYDTVHIIEINPRMASQFADLYEKVDGVNSYRMLLDISVGKNPVYAQGDGSYKVAASFVMRTFKDQWVISVPTHTNTHEFYKQFPNARLQIFVKNGQKLSDVFQDGKSFRYGLVHLGADDWDQLYQKYECSMQLLPFTFGDIT